MLPEVVKKGIESALGRMLSGAEAAVGGLNDRTFRVTAGDQLLIARCETADGLQLRRAARAQEIARSAGVSAPRVVASDFGPTDPGSYVWMVEEHLPGEHWSDGIPGEVACALSFQLGEQLRLLHRVPMDAYGLLAPTPYPTYATFPDWLAHEEGGVEEALRLGSLDAAILPEIQAVFDRLRGLPSEGPRFGHGDTAGSNLLVDGERLVAIVDWEWTGGCDAAANVSNWWYWHRTSGDLEAFIQGYRPDSPDLFRQRVECHLVLTALMLIRVHHHYQDAGGIRDAAAALTSFLAGVPPG
jgi:aminoglycoside phosphotransferase (APT) family kinase protein